MTEQALEARRAYKREWAKRNPDKVRAQQERHWARKAAAMAEQAEQEKAQHTREEGEHT